MPDTVIMERQAGLVPVNGICRVGRQRQEAACFSLSSGWEAVDSSANSTVLYDRAHRERRKELGERMVLKEDGRK